MSKDFRPVDHIIANLHLKSKGFKPLWENPQIIFTDEKGNKEYLLDEDFVKKFPLVSFFHGGIANSWKDNKTNVSFIAECKHLESRYECIIDRFEKRLDPFIFTCGSFAMDSELKKYILSEDEYAFDYDSSRSVQLFEDRFFAKISEMDKKYKVYSGYENPGEDEKEIRKNLKLPLTKPLVFYKDKRAENSIAFVKSYRIIEEFNITGKWATLELTLDDDSKVNIHSAYFAEMQKPGFIKDMEKQEKELDADELEI